MKGPTTWQRLERKISFLSFFVYLFIYFFAIRIFLSAFSHPHPPSAAIRSAFYRHPLIRMNIAIAPDVKRCARSSVSIVIVKSIPLKVRHYCCWTWICWTAVVGDWLRKTHLPLKWWKKVPPSNIYMKRWREKAFADGERRKKVVAGRLNHHTQPDKPS